MPGGRQPSSNIRVGQTENFPLCVDHVDIPVSHRRFDPRGGLRQLDVHHDLSKIMQQTRDKEFFRIFLPDPGGK